MSELASIEKVVLLESVVLFSYCTADELVRMKIHGFDQIRADPFTIDLAEDLSHLEQRHGPHSYSHPVPSGAPA